MGVLLSEDEHVSNGDSIAKYAAVTFETSQAHGLVFGVL